MIRETIDGPLQYPTFASGQETRSPDIRKRCRISRMSVTLHAFNQDLLRHIKSRSPLRRPRRILLYPGTRVAVKVPAIEQKTFPATHGPSLPGCPGWLAPHRCVLMIPIQASHPQLLKTCLTDRQESSTKVAIWLGGGWRVNNGRHYTRTWRSRKTKTSRGVRSRREVRYRATTRS